MKVKDIKKELGLVLSFKRFKHTKGVVETAVELAELYGVDVKDAKTAALLHDCAKCYDDEQMLRQCKKYGLRLEKNLIDFPAVIHAFLGARIAEIKYEVRNDDVLNAIRYHTTGRDGMSILEKIIYVADYIEPNREEYEELREIKRVSKLDINEAFTLCVKSNLRYMETKHQKVHPLTYKINIGGNKMNNIDNNKEEILKAAKIAYGCIDEKFGKDTLVLDVAGISSLADYFIISSGNNHSQLKAIADEVESKLFELGLKLRHSEGYATGKWILLDFGSIIVHLFEKEEREFYNIEKNWGNAKHVSMS